MHWFIRAAVLALPFAGALILLSGEARACGDAPAMCQLPVRLFPSLGPVPSNLVYFKVLVDEPGELTLRTQDGSVIPASIRTVGHDEVFAPDASVASGLSLELEYTTICPPFLEPQQEIYTFSTTDQMEIGLQAPALEVYEQGVRYPGLYGNESVFARLHYYPPAADASAVHLMDHFVTVDGYGYPHSGDDLMPTVDIQAQCLPESKEISPGSGSCGWIASFGTGVHHVVAWSTVVGDGDEPEKAELDVDLDCSAVGALVSPTGSAGEAGMGSTGEGTIGGGGSGEDASVKPANGPAVAVGAGSGGGCSLSRSSRSEGLLSWVGLLLSVAVFARQRRALHTR